MEREIRYASVYQRQMPIHIRTSVATTHGGIRDPSCVAASTVQGNRHGLASPTNVPSRSLNIMGTIPKCCLLQLACETPSAEYAKADTPEGIGQHARSPGLRRDAIDWPPAFSSSVLSTGQFVSYDAPGYERCWYQWESRNVASRDWAMSSFRSERQLEEAH